MKRSLIIGASRGLGLAMVDEQLRRGWRVTATVRSPSEGLTALQNEAGDRLTVEKLDINDGQQRLALAERLKGQTFDLLFLNAGILVGWDKPIEDIHDTDVTATFFTNAISPIRAAAALSDTVAAGGMIAFMSSILGSIEANRDGRADLYRASRAALNSLATSFYARHADRDLTMLLLHPGVVRTAMGGPNAPLDIETSVQGLADVIDARWGSGGIKFVDYCDDVIPW